MSALKRLEAVTVELEAVGARVISVALTDRAESEDAATAGEPEA